MKSLTTAYTSTTYFQILFSTSATILATLLEKKVFVPIENSFRVSEPLENPKRVSDSHKYPFFLRVYLYDSSNS